MQKSGIVFDKLWQKSFDKVRRDTNSWCVVFLSSRAGGWHSSVSPLLYQKNESSFLVCKSISKYFYYSKLDDLDYSSYGSNSNNSGG
jgi:hypothetical protein